MLLLGIAHTAINMPLRESKRAKVFRQQPHSTIGMAGVRLWNSPKCLLQVEPLFVGEWRITNGAPFCTPRPQHCVGPPHTSVSCLCLRPVLNQACGVDAAICANNHAGDWGPQGLVETFHTLKEADVIPVGIGLTHAAAYTPALIRPHVGCLALACRNAGTPPHWAATETAAGIAVSVDALGQRDVQDTLTKIAELWASQGTPVTPQDLRSLLNPDGSGTDRLTDEERDREGVRQAGLVLTVSAFHTASNTRGGAVETSSCPVTYQQIVW